MKEKILKDIDTEIKRLERAKAKLQEDEKIERIYLMGKIQTLYDMWFYVNSIPNESNVEG